MGRGVDETAPQAIEITGDPDKSMRTYSTQICPDKTRRDDRGVALTDSVRTEQLLNEPVNVLGSGVDG